MKRCFYNYRVISALFLPLLVLIHLNDVEAFCILRQRSTSRISSTTRLFYQNETFIKPFVTLSGVSCMRNKLKKELAISAIEKYNLESYESNMTTVCENLMKQLETVRPIHRTAFHDSLNARWSFVFTGEPTIGMKLITVLSRLSVGLHFIDFRDVYLEVFDQQSQATATVNFDVCGVPVLLNVYTNLRPTTSPTKLIEKFEGIRINGFRLPTPASWNKERDLEISYLDKDMMIVRTAGGEPHFLLRHSPCSTDDETCDIENTVTEFFQDARQKYGEKISRCLVDRKYGSEDEGFPLWDAAQGLKNILWSRHSH